MSEEKPVEEEEPIWEFKKTPIHPALDFVNGQIFLTQKVPKSDYREENLLITNLINGNGFWKTFYNEKTEFAEYSLKTIPAKIERRWELDDIKKYIEGQSEIVTIPQVFNEIRTQLSVYFELSEEEYTYLSLWIVGTYFFPLFEAYPYIFLNAPKRSGKTKLLTFLYCLCFNAKLVLSMTTATVFRLAHSNRCTLLIDETENIGDKEKSDFRALILNGYKKGALVPRAEEGKKRKFEVSEFEVYCPKAFANIKGIDDVLEDRCKTIILRRTRNKKIANLEVEIQKMVWKVIRNHLYLLAFQTKNSVVSAINEVSVGSFDTKNILIHNETVLNSLKPSCTNYTKDTNYTSESEPTKKEENTQILGQENCLKNIDICGRDFERWMPIFALAKCVSIETYNQMIDFAETDIKNKALEDAAETSDNVLMETLVGIVGDKEDSFFKISEIVNILKDRYDESNWITTRSIGRAIKRLGFEDKKRIARGIEVRLPCARVQDYATRLGINVEEALKNYKEWQQEKEAKREDKTLKQYQEQDIKVEKDYF